MYLAAVIVREWRCTWQPWSCQFGDALGGRHDVNLEAVVRASLEICLEPVIERDSRCTWRTWSCKNGGVLWGGQFGAGRLGGRRAGSSDFIYWLTCNCGNVESWVQHGLLRDERLAGSRRQSIMGWRSMRHLPYSVYAILGVNSWSWHGKIVSDDLTSFFQVMVELKMRIRKQTVYWGYHHEKLGLKRISCASQFSILDTAGTTPDMGCNYTDTRSSQPNQASCTPDFSYPLVSSTSFSYSSPISLFLVHNSTIIAESKV